MKNRLVCIAGLTLCLSNIIVAQPSGTIDKTDEDISFSTDSQIRVRPKSINVVMLLNSASDDENTAAARHTEVQNLLFKSLEKIGTNYEGQVAEEFETTTSTSLVRRSRTYNVSSKVTADAITDKQLVALAALIDQTDNLEFESFVTEYGPNASPDEVQKNVVNELISEAQAHQKAHNTTLSPRGISKMEIETEYFGEEEIEELLEDNDLDRASAVSAEAIQLMGIQHEISAEILFR